MAIIPRNQNPRYFHSVLFLEKHHKHFNYDQMLDTFNIRLLSSPEVVACFTMQPWQPQRPVLF